MPQKLAIKKEHTPVAVVTLNCAALTSLLPSHFLTICSYIYRPFIKPYLIMLHVRSLTKELHTTTKISFIVSKQERHSSE